MFGLLWAKIKRTGALQRHNIENLKQKCPEKFLRGLSPNFPIHVSVSDLYIPTIDLPAYSAAGNMWADPRNTKISHRHMNVEIWTEAEQFPKRNT
jgi:hypothetical protein